MLKALLNLIAIALFVGTLAISVGLSLLFVTLIIHSISYTSIWFGLTGSLASFFPALFAWTIFSSKKKLWLKSIGLFAGLILLSFVALLIQAPDGNSIGNGGHIFQSHFLKEKRYQRYSIFNLLPEGDQLIWGSVLIPFLDKRLTHKKSKKLRSSLNEIYTNLMNSSEYNQLGTQLIAGYQDILTGVRNDDGHIYTYTPRKKSDSDPPFPVVIFLHGSLGNFKAYLYVWRQLADRYRFGIVAPSFGVGYWQNKGALETIELSRHWVLTQPNLDSSKIHLAGISNGGIGVSRVAAQVNSTTTYKGLIFLSPVMVEVQKIKKNWVNKRILILSGKKDKRIPIESLIVKSKTLQTAGVKVELSIFPEDDHFFFLTRQKETIERIGNWLKSN